MTPGFLIHYEGEHTFRFCPIIKDGTNKIDNTLSWSERILVNNKQENYILLFVEPLDYSKETIMVAATATASVMRWATGRAAWAAWDADQKEFEDTGKIPGGIFLTGNGKLIWISHHDLEELLK